MIRLDRYRAIGCYLITTLLITTFVYSLISSSIQNTRKLQRLKEDVDEIALLVLHSPNKDGKAEALPALVDNMLKKRLSGIWDELSSMKKLFKGKADCSRISSNSVEESINAKGEQKHTVANIEDRVNYASDELGATILQVNAEPMCAQSFLKSLIGMDFTANPPIKMLTASMQPGSCFAYKGSKAEVTIQLAHEILLDQIALQHITKQQSPTEDTSSAPKDFQIVAIKGDLSEHNLGKFQFENNPTGPLQYFNIDKPDRYQYLKFQFETNHGHPNYTCIYRLAIFGKL